MKLFLLWDMEGASGLFAREQTWYWEPGVDESTVAAGKQLLMDDINSAASAALSTGVDELLICDTHHGGGNIELSKMLHDPRITYLTKSRGYQDGKLRWMPGLDQTVDGFLVPGHHAKSGTAGAFLPHTNNLEWADFRINGQSVGEMGIEACFAGHWGVPVILAQGDEACCAEAEAQFPGIVAARVKRAVTRDYCTGLDATAARGATAEKVVEAIDALRAGKPRPYQPSLPMTITIRMRTTGGAESAATRPGVERLDEYTVQSAVERHADVLAWLTGDGLDMVERR